ncbi:MAG: hypothetical protein B5M53_08335 [Candidatus Cloacimonas sp. 4484_209]|nr:MAG: hypothetical protein B5M53_08335 [Candidatus Cloacimonas sp. 4484_209]
MRKVLAVLLLLIFMLGCSEFMKRMAVKNLHFELAKVNLINYTPSDMTLKVDIDAENPNDIDGVIDRLEYTFLINNKDAVSGKTLNKVVVKAGEKKTFSTLLSINYLKLGTAVLNAVKSKKANYRLNGKVYMDTQIASIVFPVELFYP